MRLVIFVLFVIAIPFTTCAATLKVPSQYPHIQDAIDAAASGDTVLVSPGTYVENIDFKGKAITVKSHGGPAVTTIDGNNNGSTVLFQSGETSTTILEGFTITKGSGTSTPSMPEGGGVYCTASSSPIITRNIITGNALLGPGGGIACNASSPLIEQNVISGNYAAEGCGIYCFSSAPVIRDNAIYGNRNGFIGGGISCKESFPMIENNIIAGNHALGPSGIFCINKSAPTITNTTFYGNYNNHVLIGTGTIATIRDSIFWDISLPTYPSIYIGDSFDPSTLDISHSDVEGGKAAVFVDPGCTLIWGPGMIDADPLFTAGPDGFCYLGQLAAGQPADSPCVDAGSDLASNLGMDVLWTRTDGIADSGTVDMGYHYGPFVFPPLQTERFSILQSAGGDAAFLLHAGPSHAGRNYILLGSITGSQFGMKLPGGKATLPLTWDLFTNVVIDLINSPIFSNFMGTLDGNGSAAATFDTIVPIPGTAGLTLHFAYALNNPWDFASNPVAIEIY